MNFLGSPLRWSASMVAALLFSLAGSAAQTPTPSHNPQTRSAGRQTGSVTPKSPMSPLVQSGSAVFRKNCSFCHGRDATGGETGPDLTRSRLVRQDLGGDRIGPVVRNGRADKGMPAFEFTNQQIAGLAAFIHFRQREASFGNKGGRKGVDVADLQTGNATAGKEYFEGAGGCATCHSPTGDLAGIASRYEGLELEEQMLYPRHAKSKVMVTLASGQTITGTLEYLDEFTVGLIDGTDTYRSWRISDVQYKLDAPVEAHADLLGKYTDADIHNLMKYLQTLRGTPSAASAP
jgi:cytochrome c oxidase cbb3-type subunit III